MSSPPGGDPPTAEAVLAAIKALSIAERTRLFRALDRQPAISDGSGYVTIPRDVLDVLQRHRKELVEMQGRSIELIGNLGNQLARRNRRSDPETIRRNVEICDRRNADKRKWTLGRLAKDYGMTRQSIVSILKSEEKWRRLAARLYRGRRFLAINAPSWYDSSLRPCLPRERRMRKTEEVTSWVVYQMTIHGQPLGTNAVCEQAEWDEMEADRPGYHTLIRAGIPNECEAEKLARGTSGDAKPRPLR